MQSLRVYAQCQIHEGFSADDDVYYVHEGQQRQPQQSLPGAFKPSPLATSRRKFQLFRCFLPASLKIFSADLLGWQLGYFMF